LSIKGLEHGLPKSENGHLTASKKRIDESIVTDNAVKQHNVNKGPDKSTMS